MFNKQCNLQFTRIKQAYVNKHLHILSAEISPYKKIIIAYIKLFIN